MEYIIIYQNTSAMQSMITVSHKSSEGGWFYSRKMLCRANKNIIIYQYQAAISLMDQPVSKCYIMTS